MIVLDASVVIAIFDPRDAHHEAATRIVEEHLEEVFGISPLSLAEALVERSRAGSALQARAELRELDVQDLPLRDDAPERLAALRVSTRLPMPDCCVLLAAQDSVGAVATFDDRLGRAAVTLGLRRLP